MKQMTKGKKQSISSFSYSACIQCRRCSKCCPADIDIPQMLELYRRCRCGDMQGLYGPETNTSHRTPMDCIECGACSARCPKGFPVLNMVRKFAMLQVRIGYGGIPAGTRYAGGSPVAADMPDAVLRV